MQQCVVEQNILFDILTLLVYPFGRICFGWPNREHLIRKLLALDVNFDFVNDEEEAEESVVITVPALVRGGIFKTEAHAERFLKWYVTCAPDMQPNLDEDEGCLEHQRRMAALTNLDIVRERLLEAAIKTELVSIQIPPKPEEPLTKQLENLRTEFATQMKAIEKKAVTAEHELKKLKSGVGGDHKSKARQIAGKVYDGSYESKKQFTSAAGKLPQHSKHENQETQSNGSGTPRQGHKEIITEHQHQAATHNIFGHMFGGDGGAGGDAAGRGTRKSVVDSAMDKVQADEKAAEQSRRSVALANIGMGEDRV